MLEEWIKECFSSIRVRLLLMLLSVLCVSIYFRDTRVFEPLENYFIDARLKLKAKLDSQASDQIVLVGIDEPCLSIYGSWPWDRKVHGELMFELSKHNPSVVAFDLIFSEHSSFGGKENSESDLKMAHAAEYLSFVISGAISDKAKISGRKAVEFEDMGYTQPLTHISGDILKLRGSDVSLVPYSQLREASYFGFVNSEPDSSDGIRRKLPLVVRQGNDIYPSLALQTLIGYYDVNVDDVKIFIGDRIEIARGEKESVIIPINERGEIWINWINKARYTYNPYSALLQSYYRNNNEGLPLPKEIANVRGKIVLIGQVASGLTDLGPTPLDPISPLFLVHANVLNSVLRGDYIKTVPLWIPAVFWLLITAGQFLYLWDKHAVFGAVIPLVTLLLFILLAFLCFLIWNLLLPMAWPLASFMLVNTYLSLHNWIRESQHKNEIKTMFGSYLSPEVVQTLVESDEPPALGGRDEEITAFFSDIQGFSGFSEEMSASELVDLMVDYLSEMTDVLMEHGGTLDKFFGDAIVGFFGAPKPMPDHAYKACKAALKMQHTQLMLKKKWKAEEKQRWPDSVYSMHTRIGLCTGPAIVGNIGSKKRFNYTMMGDTVNLGARCESSAKSYGVYIMVPESTKEEAEKFSADIVFRYLDKIVVQGRVKPVNIYEVVCHQDELTVEIEQCMELFEKGQELYFKQEWVKASEYFQNALEYEVYKPGIVPGVTTNPSLVFLLRCRMMELNPPKKNWDGVYVMKTK